MIQDACAERVLTTGQAAKRLRCSQQHVIRCVDGGLLPGFRLPGSRQRRIPEGSLASFMQAYQVPQPTMFGDPRMSIEASNQVAGVAGVKCRVWTGTTAHGIPVRCLVAHVEALSPDEQEALERELHVADAGAGGRAVP